MQQKNHLLYLHLLRILGAIVVIAIHSAAPLLYEFNTVSRFDWWNTNVINSFSRWAVPIFIMVSGTLLLDKNKVEGLATFFKKRFSRVGIPFLFWFTIYYLWTYKLNILAGLNVSAISNHLLYQPPQFHLYFLYIILFLYLLTPLLQRLLHNASHFIQTLILLLFLYITLVWERHILMLVLWIPFLFYFTFPVIKSGVKKYLDMRVTAIGFLLSSTAIAYLTYERFNSNHSSPIYFYDYNNPLVVVQALSIFMTFFLMEPLFEKKIRKYEKNIVALSNATFGVYLIAPLVQDLIWDVFKVTVPNLTFSAGILNTQALLTIVISFVVIALVQKIPLLKKTV